MDKIKQNFLKFWKLCINHGGYFLTTFFNSAIPLLLLPVLTRYLEPEEYAYIALFNFYFLFSNSLIGNSLPMLISKNFYDQEKQYVAQIIGNSINLLLILSVILTCILFIFSNQIKDYINLPKLWIIIIPLISMFFIIWTLGLTVIRNQRKVKFFAIHKIGNTTFNVIISLILVVFILWGWEGRVIGISLSMIVSAIWILFYLHREGYLSFVFSIKIIKYAFHYVLTLIPDSLQKVIIAQVGIFFMQYLFTNEILGLYSVALQISISIKLLFNTLSMSWSPYVYEEFSNLQKLNKKKFVRNFYGICMILIFGVFALNIFSESLIQTLTTPAYYDASEFIPWLSVGFMFFGFYIFLMPALIKIEEQNFISKISMFNMILMILLNIGLSYLLGYIGVAMAFTIISFILVCSTFWKLQKTLQLPWLSALRIN